MNSNSRVVVGQWLRAMPVALLAALFATSAMAAKNGGRGSDKGNAWGTVSSGSGGKCQRNPVAPTIDGLPTFSLMESENYRFTPTASDRNCDTLTFSISGQPSWATFNAADGTLSGKPPVGSARSYQGVSISVSDGTYTASLPAFTITVYGNAAPVLSGTPPGKVASGQRYDFVPIAFDPDGQTAEFQHFKTSVVGVVRYEDRRADRNPVGKPGWHLQRYHGQCD